MFVNIFLKQPLGIVTNLFTEQGSKRTGKRFPVLPPFSLSYDLKEKIL
jgi:hypothetical protein